MIKRNLAKILDRYANFPAIAVLGPRQSGKTTLVQDAFPKHKYLSLEDESTRQAALEDPKRFLSMYENDYGIILDEFQHAPKILSYLQLHIDTHDRPGYFVLTGSQNFLMNQAITQSLAGRVGIVNLYPLSSNELSEHNLLDENVDEVMFKGFYPRVHHKNLPAPEFYSSYIQSYVERDVRQLINVGDLNVFQKFLTLCAGRVGQLLNLEALGAATGITGKTAKAWLSILQASYVIFLLEPHHKNFNKRVTKTPKLYFYDTGLACSLLKISTVNSLAIHPYRPALFECFIIADLYKQYSNLGMRPPLYFWRDKNGTYEVDCIVDQGINLVPIEIKSGQTINTDYFKGLKYWCALSETDPALSYIVYGGTEQQSRNAGHVLGWKKSNKLVSMLQANLP